MSVYNLRISLEPQLLKVPGVTGVGNLDDRIRLYVEGTPDIFPTHINNVKLEVVKTGKIRPLALMNVPWFLPKKPMSTNRTGRVRPLIGGISIAHPKITAGTLGCAIKLGGIKYGLSNNHVLAAASSAQNPRASIGDPIYSPGPYDGGTEADTVGTLYWYKPFDEKGVNVIDAALFKPATQDLLSEEILDIGLINGIGVAAEGGNVQKSGRCFTKETLILTNPNGPKTIDELNIGNSVYTLNESTGKLETAKIKNILNQGLRDVYCVKTRNRTVEVTSNHPFLVVVNRKKPLTRANDWTLEWRELDKIKIGDSIVSLHHIEGEESQNNKIKKNFARLLGFFVGDGSVRYKRSSGGRIDLFCSNLKEAEYYKNIIEETFEDTLHIFRCERCGHDFRGKSGNTCSKCGHHHTTIIGKIKRKATIKRRDNHFIVYYYSSEVAKTLQKLIPGKKLDKHVPKVVWGWPTSLRESFLEGFCDADGHRYKHHSSGKSRVYSFCSPNERLIKESRELFITCGIRVTNLYSRIKEGYTKRKIWEFKSYPDTRSKKSNRKVFVKGKTIIKSGISKLDLPETLQLEPVVAIKYTGKKQTFDIEVDDSHNFIGNGILLHNTTGVTVSDVLDVNATVKVDYGIFGLTLSGQIITNYMADGGDSGSSLLDMDRNLVGLLFAGSSYVTVHNNIAPIIQAISGAVPGAPGAPATPATTPYPFILPPIVGSLIGGFIR